MFRIITLFFVCFWFVFVFFQGGDKGLGASGRGPADIYAAAHFN